MARSLPFVPLRDEFFELVLGEKEWHRNKENPSLGPGELTHREVIILRELGKNSKKSFAEIEQENSLTRGSARYAYDGLKEKGIIVRPTLTLQDLPVRYVGVVLLEVRNSQEVRDARPKLLEDAIEYGDVSNKYALIGNIGNPDGIIRFFPVLHEDDFDRISNKNKADVKGTIVRTFLKKSRIKSGLIPCGLLSPETSTQVWQSTHMSLSTFALSFSIAIADAGHSLTQVSHPVHLLLSTTVPPTSSLHRNYWVKDKKRISIQE